MKIAVLGAGSLGSVIGGRLAQSGHDVILINRNAAYVEAVQQNGLVLTEATRRESIPLTAARSPEGQGPVDLVIVLVKSFHTDTSMRAALNLIGPDTVVLSLQNGLGHEEVLAGIVGAGRVIAGKTYAGGVMTAPGEVIAGTRGKQTVIGELSGSLTPRILAIAAAFEAAGLACTASTDIVGAMWDKLLVNVATGALSGITGLDYGNLYDLPELAETAQEAVAEAMVVAQAQGICLQSRSPKAVWDRAAAGLPFTFKASILQSLEKGSPTEIDYINGAVVRAGAAWNVPTPVNATLVACVKGIERSLAPRREAAA